MRSASVLTAIAALTTVAALTARPAQAQTAITGLFNTGVSATNTPLTVGTVDPHYVFINGNTTSQTVVSSFQGPSPYAFDANSRYIWNDVNGQPGNGTFILRLTFNLTGLDPTTAQISGRYSTDNSGLIRLNGTGVGTASTGFGAFTPFTITTGFVAGVNNLDFVVTDVGPPGGLGVTDLVGTARTVQGNAAAPEPGTIGLLAASVLPCVGLIARRRKA